MADSYDFTSRQLLVRTNRNRDHLCPFQRLPLELMMMVVRRLQPWELHNLWLAFGNGHNFFDIRALVEHFDLFSNLLPYYGMTSRAAGSDIPSSQSQIANPNGMTYNELISTKKADISSIRARMNQEEAKRGSNANWLLKSQLNENIERERRALENLERAQLEDERREARRMRLDWFKIIGEGAFLEVVHEAWTNKSRAPKRCFGCFSDGGGTGDGPFVDMDDMVLCGACLRGWVYDSWRKSFNEINGLAWSLYR